MTNWQGAVALLSNLSDLENTWKILTDWPWDSWGPAGRVLGQLAWPFLLLSCLFTNCCATSQNKTYRQTFNVLHPEFSLFLFYSFSCFCCFFGFFLLFCQAKRGFVAIETNGHKRFRPPLHVNSSTREGAMWRELFSVLPIYIDRSTAAEFLKVYKIVPAQSIQKQHWLGK